MTTKQPNAFDDALFEYLAQFNYRITVKLGHSHTAEFKEFNEWCELRLGNKYKDWFITSNSKGVYTLFCRDSKWASFLALTHVDKLI
jgi:hypothetical protein